MTWDVEYTDEFGGWWANLTQDEQVSLAASVQLLEARGHIANSERNMAGDLFARCTLLIRAEWLYDQHLVQLRREGAIDG
jgi:hypothetical protein